MRTKSMLLVFTLTLYCFCQSSAQICNISSGPYDPTGLNHSRMTGDEFKAIVDDLPFIPETESKRRYTQFWVKANVLNIRSGPSLQNEIISETYYGENVLAFAKVGDWVAIGTGLTFDDTKIYPQWVHIDYLSSVRTMEQVDTEVLKRKCSFEEYGKYSSKINALPEQELRNLANVYDPCSEVRSYLSRQRLSNERHDYVHEYEAWRQLQNNPDEYSRPPCYPTR